MQVQNLLRSHPLLGFWSEVATLTMFSRSWLLQTMKNKLKSMTVELCLKELKYLCSVKKAQVHMLSEITDFNWVTIAYHISSQHSHTGTRARARQSFHPGIASAI